MMRAAVDDLIGYATQREGDDDRDRTFRRVRLSGLSGTRPVYKPAAARPSFSNHRQVRTLCGISIILFVEAFVVRLTSRRRSGKAAPASIGRAR